MRSIVALTLLAVAGGFGVVKSLPDGDAHAAPLVVKTKQVQSISIDGGRGLPVSSLREVMQTRIGNDVDTATLEQDRRALERQLAQRGYLAAKVAAPSVSFCPAGGVCVVFDVERGPLYHVRNVRLDGPSWADAGVVPVASGDDAAVGRLERVRQAAADTLSRHGKQLEVELTIEPDHADAMIDVRFATR